MEISIRAGGRLGDDERREIARYRHKVFVEVLGWPLPTDGQIELDEFDTDATMHLVARADDGAIVGYSRLLRTTGEYLLARHFPHLVDEAMPRHASVWELSRYSARPAGVAALADDPTHQTRVGKLLLLAAVRHVETQGGREIVFCTTTQVERLARRWGVDIDRLGRPCRSDGEALVGARIHCNSRTVVALDLDAGAGVSQLATSGRAEAIPPGMTLGIDFGARSGAAK